MPRAYRPRGIPLVRRYIRKRTYSTADRILIHLSTDALQPEEQTQTGIAAATLSARPTLTKWLDRLKRRDLVARTRIRLPGQPLPKYAYQLTGAGWKSAEALRQQLASDLVTVRARSLGELSVRIAEVPGLAASRLGLTTAVAAVRKRRLDLVRMVSPARPRDPVLWGSGLRRVDRFFGRTAELAVLNAWWASESQALLLTGLPGIGKSALVAAWVQGRQLGSPVYGFEIRRTSTATGLLSDFGAFLATLGKPALATHLAQGVPLDAAFVSRLVARDLGGSHLLVVLDNADQATKGVARQVMALFLSAKRRPMKVVLVGRRYPRWLATGRFPHTALQVRSIQGLDSPAAWALLRSRGIGADSSVVEEILRRTRGHPLLLHLTATTGPGRVTEIQRYLAEEVWSSLSAGERSVLEATSVFRKPVSPRVLESVAGGTRRTLDALTERNLLEQTIAGGYVMHDLVREFVIGQLSDARRGSLHERAANVLLRGTDPRERWEAIVHLLEAGRVARAAALLDSEGTSLMDGVAAEDVTALLRGRTLNEYETRTYCVFAEILGDSLRIRGHVGPALFQYGHARRLAERSGDGDRLPRLLRKMGFLERCKTHYGRALGYLVEAYAQLHEGRNPTELAEVLREMALVEQAQGELDQAARHLNEAIDLATDLPDRAALSRTLLALGSLQTRQGHLEQGLASNLEGLRVAERSGNLTEVAHAHIVVGTTLEELGRLNESLSHYEKGEEIALLLGNLRLTAYGALGRTGALIELGRFRDAGHLVRDAEGYFGTLEERDTLALLKTFEGQRQMGLGHWNRAKTAWEEGLAALRDSGSPADLAASLKQIGEFYVRHGEFDRGRTHLAEAVALSAKIGNTKLRREAEALLFDADRRTSPRVSA